VTKKKPVAASATAQEVPATEAATPETPGMTEVIAGEATGLAHAASPKEQQEDIARESAALAEPAEHEPAAAEAPDAVHGGLAMPAVKPAESATQATAADGKLRAGAQWINRVKAGNQLLEELVPDLTPENFLLAESDHSRAATLVAPCEGATRLLMTFGGNTGFLLTPPPIVHMPDCHVISIRDPKRCFALAGVPGLGERYETCVENLRRIIATLGAKDIFVAGVSAGGYPALRYGFDLGAQGVLGMSAPTTLNLGDDPNAPMSRYPQLTALYRERPEVAIDLVPLYANTLPRPNVILAYSPSNVRDSWLANRMRGINGVDLVTVDDEAGHRVFTWLSKTNEMPYYLGKLMGLRQITEA
jgi:hypothetical protein